MSDAGPARTLEVVPPEFPGTVEVTRTTTETPQAEAEHQRRLQLLRMGIYQWTAFVFLIVLVAATGLAGYLVYSTAISAQPAEQRLAFGVIGGALGALWGNFGKLVETASGRK